MARPKVQVTQEIARLRANFEKEFGGSPIDIPLGEYLAHELRRRQLAYLAGVMSGYQNADLITALQVFSEEGAVEEPIPAPVVPEPPKAPVVTMKRRGRPPKGSK